jgi:signal transduction histidine kinase
LHGLLGVRLEDRAGRPHGLVMATDKAEGEFTAEDEALLRQLAAIASLGLQHIEARDEAQAALRARDEFLGVAAHELKTPITSLRGYAELTLRRIEKQGTADPAMVRRALEVIDHQADRLGNLVGQLLELSRLEAGELHLQLEVVDLAALARRVVESLQPTTRRHTLSYRGPATLPARVDRLRIEQVLINLLDNAIRYSPDGGPVEVELSLPEPGAVRLTVRDRGIGVPPAQRARLFSRFFQAAERPVGGLGLGLYANRRIAELHGGEIHAEFPPEGGSLFVVTLPTGLPQEPEQAAGEKETG